MTIVLEIITSHSSGYFSNFWKNEVIWLFGIRLPHHQEDLLPASSSPIFDRSRYQGELSRHQVIKFSSTYLVISFASVKVDLHWIGLTCRFKILRRLDS